MSRPDAGDANTSDMARFIYGRDFFREVEDGSATSAAAAVPIILETFPSQKVLDIGSGEGAWPAEFARFGCEVLAVDGEYVDRERLRVPPNDFLGLDLRLPLPQTVVNWGADLVVCLEVAEHLPADRGPSFIKDLCNSSHRIVFSAATPGQGGHGHINERPHTYWKELFENEGFTVSTELQGRFAQSPSIAWWYSKNVHVATKYEGHGYRLSTGQGFTNRKVTL